MRLPELVIAGVTKAGTTSLFGYLAQHPDVGVPDEKEIHHYAPMVDGNPPPPLDEYAAHFARSGERQMYLEASPRYFIGGRPLVERMVDDLRSAGRRPRVVVVLREPVDRMWSSYTYKRSKDRLPADVDLAEFVRRCRRVHDEGLLLDPDHEAYRTLAVGVYADFLPAWVDVLGEDLKVVFLDQLRQPTALLTSLCEWAGLDPSPVTDFDTAARNATYQPRSRSLRRAAGWFNDNLAGVLAEASPVRRGLRASYRRLNSGTLDESFDPDVRAELESFYAPTLPPLRDLLHRHGTTDLPAWLA